MMLVLVVFNSINVFGAVQCVSGGEMEKAKYVVIGKVVDIKPYMLEKRQYNDSFVADYYKVKIKIEKIRFGKNYKYTAEDEKELEKIKEKGFIEISSYKFNKKGAIGKTDANYEKGERFQAYLINNYNIGEVYETFRGYCGKSSLEDLNWFDRIVNWFKELFS